MIERAQLNELMLELFDEVTEIDKNIVFSDRAKDIIKEVAAWARNTNFFKNNKERITQFWSDPATKTARNIYIFLCCKIIAAPTSLHRDCSIIAHMPELDNVLNGKEVAG